MWIRKFSAALLRQWERDEDRTMALDRGSTDRRSHAAATPANQAEHRLVGLSGRRLSVRPKP